MTSFANILRFASVAAFLGGPILSAGAAQAGASFTMKPLQGVSFDFGSERAVGYFLPDDGKCALVITRASTAPNWDDDFITFSASRFEANVPSDRKTKYHAADGKVIEFLCESSGAAMVVTRVDEVAAGPQH